MNEQLNNTIRDYLEMALRRKWWLIIPSVTFFMASVVVVVSFQPPDVYKASTLILIESQKVPKDFVRSVITGSAGEWLTTIRQRLLSRSLLQRVADEFGLYQEPDSRTPTLLEEVLDKLGWHRERSDQINPEVNQGEIIKKMRKKIGITTVGKRKINSFTISFEGQDPRTVMQVTNRLAGMLIEANLKAREQLVKGTSEFLGQELDRLRQTLEEQEAKVSEFKRQYRGELPSQLVANLRALDRFQLELEATRQAIREEEERKASLEQDLASGNVLPGQPGFLEARLSELKNTLAKLQSKYRETYPDIILTKQEIQGIEAQLAQRPSTSEDSVAPDMATQTESVSLLNVKKGLKRLRDKEKKLARKINEYERRVEQAPMREQDLTRLVRDYENTQNNYQALLNKKLNAKISENLEKHQKGEQFRIIDPAQIPTKPIKPNRLKIIFLGLIAGLGIGFGLVVMREQMDTSFHNQEDLEKATGLVILATIPNFKLGLKSPYALTAAHTGRGTPDSEREGP